MRLCQSELRTRRSCFIIPTSIASSCEALLSSTPLWHCADTFLLALRIRLWMEQEKKQTKKHKRKLTDGYLSALLSPFQLVLNLFRAAAHLNTTAELQSALNYRINCSKMSHKGLITQHSLCIHWAAGFISLHYSYMFFSPSEHFVMNLWEMLDYSHFLLRTSYFELSLFEEPTTQISLFFQLKHSLKVPFTMWLWTCLKRRYWNSLLHCKSDLDTWQILLSTHSSVHNLLLLETHMGVQSWLSK